MVGLVTGGARSGKSTFAEKYAEKLGSAGIYVATSQIFDTEMEQRVELHQKRRIQASFSWDTVEEPYELAALLDRLQEIPEVAAHEKTILVDCLTLWLSNWLLRFEQDDPNRHVLQKVDELVQLLSSFKGNLLLVSNEVGYGIVPDSSLGRLFRDLAGIMNQRVASVCDQVFLVASGIPVELKSIQYKL
ncbi:bifunctional adenosylcobinamide kinase/adenosylcobinamide-phosphate guanylyltransferase [Brevibacillus ginsengisoli]|uniref:bifunctional adenosylcobinamide kinase/adenosylcobinamide-phosphate guanylyltransferase n=1 Tax=Brevibacillus ginsengisoli TaxID=363854 RepID=UPI003CF56563